MRVIFMIMLIILCGDYVKGNHICLLFMHSCRHLETWVIDTIYTNQCSSWHCAQESMFILALFIYVLVTLRKNIYSITIVENIGIVHIILTNHTHTTHHLYRLWFLPFLKFLPIKVRQWRPMIKLNVEWNTTMQFNNVMDIKSPYNKL